MASGNRYRSKVLTNKNGMSARAIHSHRARVISRSSASRVERVPARSRTNSHGKLATANPAITACRFFRLGQPNSRSALSSARRSSQSGLDKLNSRGQRLISTRVRSEVDQITAGLTDCRVTTRNATTAVTTNHNAIGPLK